MIPIFILTCDRLTVLKKSMASYYDYIKTPFKIVIIDFDSTYEPTMGFLRDLERRGVKVYRRERIGNKRRVNILINGVVQDYFKNHPASNYVVTDPDIALDNVEGDVLDVYAYLLKEFPQIPIVGPIMRTDDLPDCFPGKEGIINWENRINFGLGKVNSIQYKDRVIKFVRSRIDTTFRMDRAGAEWRCARGALRVLPPYGSKHLDWYLDPDNLTQDQKYYMEHASSKLGHAFQCLQKK